MYRLNGTGVALVTPMLANGEIDFPSLKKLLQHTSKADYYVVMGTTGESATLEDDEKRKVLDFVLQHNKKELPVVYGIGGNNTSDVLKRLDSVRGLPLTAIMSVCPYYNKPSQEGIYKHFSLVADRAPAPLVLYNVPGRTSVNMTASTTVRLAAHGNITAIKEASGNIEQAIRILAEAQSTFRLISGDDMLTVPLMSVGAVGVISVLANAFPSPFSKMTAAALSGQFKKAANYQLLFNRINALMYEEGNPSGIKEVLAQMGIIQNHARLPMAPVSEALSKKIQQALVEIKKG